MVSPYTKKYFTKNRERLRSNVSSEMPIVISGNTQMQFSADSAYPFRQDTNFWYLTGIDEPDVLYVHDGQKEVLILPRNNAIRDVFDGAADIETMRNISGVDRILSYKQGLQHLKKLVNKYERIATLLPATGLQRHYGITPNPARKRLVNKLRRMRAGLTFYHVGHIFAQLRMMKSTEELKAIQSSIDLTVEAFLQTQTKLRPGIKEYEIEADITAFFRKNNAHHAYPPIIAGGKRACTLHYNKNLEKIKKNESILMDVGAEVYRGAADITRTYYIGDKPTKRCVDVYNAVLHVQEYAFSRLKPGVAIQEYEKEIEKEMGRVLKDLGLIKKATKKTIRKYYPHATSHFLGLDVHDAADYSRKLEPGMVLTVEPGIYLPEESIGIRIEDDVLVTVDGIDVLSKALPRHL